MNEHHTKRLLEAYPNLYKELKYFECGDGWYNLIEELSYKLEELILRYKEFNSEYLPYAEQVKEKYGCLSFYMSTSTCDMGELTHKARITSQRICEVCGEKGELIRDGYYRVRCQEHSR